MITIVMQGLAWLAFVAGTVALGAWLRRHPGRRSAERASRVVHLLFWTTVVPAAGLGVLYPGLSGYDRVLGLGPLPRSPLVPLLGALGLLAGACLFTVSTLALWVLGQGASAFWLTRRLVAGSIYGRMRHPMALGFYLGAAGLGLLAGSTYMTLGALLVVIPAHLFYLKYFEECELALRLGPPYVEYKRSVPFLLPRCTSGKCR
jgi:protein-S-isoprenylcysteine O-methyltransferase Ste14